MAAASRPSVVVNGVPGAIGVDHSATVDPSRRRSTMRASACSAVVATPSSTVVPCASSPIAASSVACTAGPMSWIGYQYWRNRRVSPGASQLKSGWLSVKTPAMSST